MEKRVAVALPALRLAPAGDDPQRPPPATRLNGALVPCAPILKVGSE